MVQEDSYIKGVPLVGLFKKFPNDEIVTNGLFRYAGAMRLQYIEECK